MKKSVLLRSCAALIVPFTAAVVPTAGVLAQQITTSITGRVTNESGAPIGGATVVVTDNRRHFLSALRYGMRVETPTEFATALKPKRS